MKHVHLLAGLAACAILTAIIAAGAIYARSVEYRFIYAVAPKLYDQTNQGIALQREAFRHADLLPFYGSSEVVQGASQYAANKVFRSYPTGFAPFEVAHPGVTALFMAECLAGVGPDLRGKKVVISFTPAMFNYTQGPDDWYVPNFSILHAYQLAFSDALSPDTKRLAARRALAYPQTVRRDPLLQLALRSLVRQSRQDRLTYYALWPLGKLRILVLTLQDHWEVLHVLRDDKLAPDVPREAHALDWPTLLTQAAKATETRATSNPYGIEDPRWVLLRDQVESGKAKTTDEDYLRLLESSAEWTDLDILLRVLKELGAQPLVMSRPINGTYYSLIGISPDAQQAYYDHLEKAVHPYGFPVVDFADHTMDKYFSLDSAEHTSRKGWVYVDQVLDDFYHDRPTSGSTGE
jgi:D-alanine transfer protein